MKLGTISINDCKLGNTQIQKVYRGTTLIWERAYDMDFQVNVVDVAVANGFTLPSSTILGYLNQHMLDLKSSGVWNTLDAYAYFALNDTSLWQFSIIDWKRNGVIYTSHGGMAYNVNGWKGNGVNGYLNTLYNPAVNAVNLTLSSINVGHTLMPDYSNSSGAVHGIQNSSPNRRLALFPSATSNRIYPWGHDYTSDFTVVSPNTTKRMIAYGRSDSSNRYSNVNNLTRVTIAIATISPLVTGDYYINGLNVSGTAQFFCDGTAVDFNIGGSLTHTQQQALFTSKNTLMTALGLTTIT